jgi:hypothetical protein
MLSASAGLDVAWPQVPSTQCTGQTTKVRPLPASSASRYASTSAARRIARPVAPCAGSAAVIVVKGATGGAVGSEPERGALDADTRVRVERDDDVVDARLQRHPATPPGGPCRRWHRSPARRHPRCP